MSEPVPMKVASVEPITNFGCGKCGLWWSISDFQLHARPTMFCTWCGAVNKVPEKILTGADFNAAN